MRYAFVAVLALGLACGDDGPTDETPPAPPIPAEQALHAETVGAEAGTSVTVVVTAEAGAVVSGATRAEFQRTTRGGEELVLPATATVRQPDELHVDVDVPAETGSGSWDLVVYFRNRAGVEPQEVERRLISVLRVFQPPE